MRTKEQQKQYITEVFYIKDLDTYVSVDINGTIISMPHNRQDILSLEYQLDNCASESISVVNIMGSQFDVPTATSLSALGKKVNVDIYNYYTGLIVSIDALTEEDNPEDVTWEYDITKVWVL